eukprot:gene4924-9823_t
MRCSRIFRWILSVISVAVFQIIFFYQFQLADDKILLNLGHPGSPHSINSCVNDSIHELIERDGSGSITVRENSSSPNRCFIAKRGANDSISFCYPTITVMGFPKSGTSFLFKSLSKHPQIVATKRKELCYGGPKSELWWDFISRMPSPETTDNRHVLSGCLHLGANKEASQSLCVSDAKYIFVVRDVADMLWAAYNYWCISTIDKNCFPGGRTTKNNKRTPEHFHELITTNKTLGGGLPLDINGICYKGTLLEAVKTFGQENIHVLKSEHMSIESSTSNRNQSFQKLFQFLKLSTDKYPQWIDEVITKPTPVNAGHLMQTRGEFVEITDVNTIVRGTYEISGFRPMLSQTKTFIHVRWREECIWLRNVWGISYDACNS